MTANPPASQSQTVPVSAPAASGRGKKPGGGTAAGGGINFQAAVTAIAGAHLLRGAPLGWLPVADIPVAVSAESEGAGDDLLLEFSSGATAEVQAKKGLNRNADLWGSLEAMALALQSGELEHGVLAVAADSSGTVREELPKDLARLGEGRTDNLTDIGGELHQRLQRLGGSLVAACQQLRIRVIHALEAEDADVRLAKELLRQVCADAGQAEAAWNALHRDAVRLIEQRGRWSMHHLLRLLRREGISLRENDFPAGVFAKLTKWVVSTHADFSVPAIKKRLPLNALLHMTVIGTSVDEPKAKDAATAMARYHGVDGKMDSESPTYDAEWIGRFKRLAVVVAGPGLGKSTLMKVLAHRYASDDFPVLSVALKSVAAAMARGNSFGEALTRHALDGSSLKPGLVDTSKCSELVVLADGLDECGNGHEDVAEALVAFSVGHPSARIIVTTRPIGYTTSALSSWNHYRLAAPDKGDGPRNLGSLLAAVKGPGETNWRTVAREQLSTSKVGETISTSPHLLCMAAALIATKGSLPESKPKLYSELIGLFEKSGSRPGAPAVPAAVATSVLNILGWQLVGSPLAPASSIVDGCAKVLALELGRPQLAAMESLEPALDYWERVGIIEKLHHDGSAYWTFVHKTFAEFCAARYLVSIPQDVAVNELRQRLDNATWEEVVRFASSLGLGELVVNTLVEGKAATSIGRMHQALGIAVAEDAGIGPACAQQLVDLAFELMKGASLSDGFKLGQALTEVADARPELVAAAAKLRINDNHDAIQLAAWACVAAVSPGSYTAADFEGILDRFLPKLSIGLKFSLLGSLVLGKEADRDLADRIALAALNAHADEGCETLASRVLAHRSFHRETFFARVEAILLARGLPAPESPWKKSAVGLTNMLSDTSWIEPIGRAWRVLVEAVVDENELVTSGSDKTKLCRPYPQFGALVAGIQFYEAPLTDTKPWAKPYDRALMRELMQAVINSSSIDPLEIAHEASLMVKHGASNEDFDGFRAAAPRVDAADPDWRAAALLMPDRARLVAAMNHGSLWMAYVAGNMLSELDSTVDEAREMLERSCDDGLWAAVQIVQSQHPKTAEKLFIDRLLQPLPPGARHLFGALSKSEPSPELHQALRLGLASPLPEIALAAAKLALQVVSRGHALDSNIFAGAYLDWKSREPKIESNGDPDSPRGTLLEVLSALKALPDDLLFEAMAEDRSSLVGTALSVLNARINESDSLRREFVERVVARSLAPRNAAAVLEHSLLLSEAQIQALEPLLSDADAKWRRVGVELLGQNYFDATQLEAHFTRLALDAEAEIRRVAARIQAKLRPSPSSSRGLPSLLRRSND